jgi:hypothetical protein
MTEPRDLADVLHDAIDDATTAAEGIHKSVAEFPLTVLAEITPFKDAIDEVRLTQEQTIESMYGLVRTINDRVRQLTTSRRD